MEITIIAPGTTCKTDRENIACAIATSIIEDNFYEHNGDVMTIHNDDNDCIAELTARGGSISICRSGKFLSYCLPDAEDYITNLICDCIAGK